MLDRAVAEFGRLDAAFNNAGVIPAKDRLDVFNTGRETCSHVEVLGIRWCIGNSGLSEGSRDMGSVDRVA